MNRNESKIVNQLTLLLFQEKGVQVYKTVALPPSGSYRTYYRLFSDTGTFIGAYNPDIKENNAFLKFTEHFIKHNLNVPEIIARKEDNNIYIVTDLGDTTLFSFIEENRKTGGFPETVVEIYKKVLSGLPEFQIVAGKTLDYSNCYPRRYFDRQSMLWDMNYFKYYFLKLARIDFDEQKLEDDFNSLIEFLMLAGCDYFLYRDFQSRNIMLNNGNIFYIDYQGGRKGSLHYDVASLLYDAKADIPQDVRVKLLKHYISGLKNYISVDEDKFLSFYYGFVLIRIMQAMGAYGFRGFYEKKEHFLQSIPYALANLKWLLDNVAIQAKMPVLLDVLSRMTKSESLLKYRVPENRYNNLLVSIYSFSFRHQAPADNSGNGGGFVFDCRALPNPGKLKEFVCLSGRDKTVIEFMDKSEEVRNFMQNVCNIVGQSAEKYISVDFTSLYVAFGCTGGQHRSVYCAENLASYLKTRFNIKVKLEHSNCVNWVRDAENS